jgi:transcription termination factor Rho
MFRPRSGFLPRSKASLAVVAQLRALTGRVTPMSEFHERTVLHPYERLRLETDPAVLTTRLVDLFMPIGKGQRAIVAAPPKAGKTTLLRDIAS